MAGAPVTFQFTGILSSDPSENQYFSDWNMIRLIPCDGGSFLGEIEGTSCLSNRFQNKSKRPVNICHLLVFLEFKHENLIMFCITF